MIGQDRPLLLGSRSPRRSAILGGMGIPLRVLGADADEQVARGENPEAYVERIARLKLEAVADLLQKHAEEVAFGAVLVADTTVTLDGDILGKPTDEEHAVELLRRITGRTHRVLTRYALARPESPGVVAGARTVESQVTMRAATEAEIRAYAATGEGLDKAGAYAIQGIGAFLVQAIDGSYTNVVGLPACEVIVDLRALGLLGSFP